MKQDRSVQVETALLSTRDFNPQPTVPPATYSSPTLRISKRPAPVPMSSSLISSVRLTMVAPHALYRINGIFRLVMRYARHG